MIPLHMEKILSRKPTSSPVPVGVNLRTFREFPEVGSWLQMRKQAFADQIQVARDWTVQDFHREFTSKEQWNEDHLAFLFWKAVPVGSIYLSFSDLHSKTAGTLNWLMVHPEYRRRGLGRILIEWAEMQAWYNSIRRITLTTLPSWDSAIQCYETCGYNTEPEP